MVGLIGHKENTSWLKPVLIILFSVTIVLLVDLLTCMLLCTKALTQQIEKYGTEAKFFIFYQVTGTPMAMIWFSKWSIQ